MTVLEVLLAPHPKLSVSCEDVGEDAFGTLRLHQFISSMAETMYAKNGVGLAAPQVGDLRRILVVDPSGEGKHHLVMINPIILSKSETTSNSSEGCLSVPGLKVVVPRSTELTMTWRDLSGQRQEWYFSGWDATVIQHELDHLNGKTLYDRASMLKRSRYLKQLPT